MAQQHREMEECKRAAHEKAKAAEKNRILQSTAAPHLGLMDLRSYPDKVLVAAVAALDRLKSLPESERAKLESYYRYRKMNRKDALAATVYCKGACYEDRIEYMTEVEQQINTYYREHVLYKLDEDNFAEIQWSSTYEEWAKHVEFAIQRASLFERGSCCEKLTSKINLAVGSSCRILGIWSFCPPTLE